MATIIEDTRQKPEKHQIKNGYWAEHGTDVIRCALPFGDYCVAPSIAVDTKQDLLEIAVNMCSSAKEKRRFREECKKAQEAGCRLVFLIEDPRFRSVDDLYDTSVYLPTGQTIPGEQLSMAMKMMAARYGCRFEFCTPEDAGRRVEELLEDANVEQRMDENTSQNVG